MCKVCLAMMGLAAAAAALPSRADSAEFSADAFEARPGLGVQSGRLYVNGASRRFDYQVRGMPVISIEEPELGIRRLVYPLSRTYLEQRFTPVASDAGPCKATAELACSKSGEGDVEGIKTEIWTIKPANAPSETRVWWDATRRLALRADYGDGRTMMAKRDADITYDGRPMEHWTVSYRIPGGPQASGEALFDPEIKAAVAEIRPDGGRRHLVNIKAGPVARSMFEVPPGFARIEDLRERSTETAASSASPANERRLQAMQLPVGRPAAIPAPQPITTTPAPGAPYLATPTLPLPGVTPAPAPAASQATLPPAPAPSAAQSPVPMPAPMPVAPAAPEAAPRAPKPPEPAKSVDLPAASGPIASTPVAAGSTATATVATGNVSPAEAHPVAIPATTAAILPAATAASVAAIDPNDPPLPVQKPTVATATVAAPAAGLTGLPALRGTTAPAKKAAKPATAKNKLAPAKSRVPNPSSIPTLSALPPVAASSTAAARKSTAASGKKRNRSANKSGSGRSKKGRRKQR